MNSPQPPREGLSPRVPKSCVVLMLVILGSMAALAVYANIQRSRRDQVETVSVLPARSRSSAVSGSPAESSKKEQKRKRNREPAGVSESAETLSPSPATAP